MKNQKLEDLFLEMANCPTLKDLYDNTASILSKATKWSFGYNIPGGDKGWSMTLDHLFTNSFAIEIYLIVKFKNPITVSLCEAGIALNIEQMGWTKPIPYADLEQNPFQERLAKVFPHGMENDLTAQYHERIHEFLKEYS